MATGLKIQAQLAETAVEHEHEERMEDKAHTHEAEMGVMNDEPEQPSGGKE
jgi:hypothetical protein